jgi:membrane carboxypeptidase/penicillin-binding protein
VISGFPGSTGAGLAIGRDAAGKTGTTNDSAAVWFSGYTPDLEATVWVGDPRGGYRFPMQNLEINGRFYEDVFGSTLPGPIWRQSMINALKDVPRHKFKLKLPANVVGDEIIEPTATPTETETETETP